MVLKDGIPVIIVDAPAFVNATSRRSISMPMETVYAVFDAARHFGARHLVLQYKSP